MKWIVAIVCLLIGGFCIFGFLATFEPTANAIAFRMGYTAIGLACLAGIAFTLIPRKEN